MATLGKSKKIPQKPWRPDFRNIDSLPDTKVIRTGFLLNFVGICVAATCLIMYGYRELTLQGLSKSVRELQAQVESATTADRQYLDLNKKFVQGAELLSEVIAFDTEPVKYHAFLAEVEKSVQTGMQLTGIILQHSGAEPGKSGIPPFHIELVGRVLENAPVTPAQVLNNFQTSIKGLPSLAGKEMEMEMVRFNRNNEFGYFDFTLLVKISVKKAPAL